MLAIGNGEILYAFTWLLFAACSLVIVLAFAWLLVTGQLSGWLSYAQAAWSWIRSLLGPKSGKTDS